MNILISTNTKYFMPTIVMLESLLKNNQTSISIYLLYSNLTQLELVTLKEFIHNKNGELIVLEVNDALFENAPVSHHFTKEIYYRLLAQDILPNDLDRVLYIDVDIIVNKSLFDFYYQDFRGKYLVVCEGIGMSRKDKQTYENLGIPFDRRYFNSGVILYNLKLLRENYDTSIFFEYIERYSEKLTMPDQDVLNAIFYDSVIYEDYKIYNYGVAHIRNKEDEEYARKNSAIIHFIGNQKPWNYKYTSYLGDLFWEHAKNTQYRKKYISYKIKNTLYRVFNKSSQFIKKQVKRLI